MQNIIKHSTQKSLANLGGVAYWSQFNAMSTSIDSLREPSGGLS
jgi:hypothetical protein